MVELLDCEPMLKDWAASASAVISPESAANYCATSFRKACTPRQPKAEWFGTGPGQWDAWMDESGRVYRNGRWSVQPACGCCNPKPAPLFNYKPICDPVIPVARTGAAIPVGWQVLERNNA